MFPTFFEPDGSSSGRRLYIQLRSGTFYMHQYKQSSRKNSVRSSCTYRTADADIKHAVLHTAIFLKMNPRV